MPNIFDVAAAAGVSHQTVSRFLKGDPTVRAATRQRIEQAVAELGYRPNAAARALASRRTRTIGLITVGLPLYGPSSTTHGFNHAARAAGWDVSIAVLEQAGAADVRHVLDALLGQDVQALVLVAPTPEVGDAVARVALDVPVVTTVPSGIPDAVAVGIDHRAAAALAVAHLADLGHREILHVAGPEDWIEAQERERGWREECERRGLATPPVLRGDWTAQGGAAIGRRLAASGLPPAIFSANDQTALGLLAAFAEAGVRVPGDVSVVGFDDIPEAAYFVPPLTTVRQDFAALGERLMHRLAALLDGTDADAAEPPTLPAELVLRASTRPA
ncbi:MAG TPA: substrate-binding domain-containing protein [Amnibacterium sp.]|nr:substrate-binding domain-containing protein [Amnibacterium sp.]